MEREGLGRGIEDISHLFLSARQKRAEAGAAQPAGFAGSSSAAGATGGPRGPLVWAAVRTAGQPLQTTWQLAWRLAPASAQGLHLAVGAETTQVRWLGQAAAPTTDRPGDLIDAADAAVIDLTDAPEAVRRRVAVALGELVVVAGPTETDSLAAYSLIKDAHAALGEVTLGLEVTGEPATADAAFQRLRDAVGHFLKAKLADWRERYPLRAMPSTGPEPPLVGAAPTETVLEALCAAASRARSAMAAAPQRPAEASPTAAPVKTAAAESRPGDRSLSAERQVKPLLAWPEPEAAELADFLEQHPHLVQPDLLVIDRGLHAAGGEAVDLLARDALGQVVTILVSTTGDAALLASGLAYARWCLREQALLKRLHARLNLDLATPPRLVLAACRFDDLVLEAARTMQRPPVVLVELRPYEWEGERAVAVSRLA